MSNRHLEPQLPDPRLCVECALEGRPEPEGPVPGPDEANPPIVSVDIVTQNPQTSEIHRQYGVELCGEHVGQAAQMEAENRSLISITVRARLTH